MMVVMREVRSDLPGAAQGAEAKPMKMRGGARERKADCEASREEIEELGRWARGVDSLSAIRDTGRLHQRVYVFISKLRQVPPQCRARCISFVCRANDDLDNRQSL